MRLYSGHGDSRVRENDGVGGDGEWGRKVRGCGASTRGVAERAGWLTRGSVSLPRGMAFQAMIMGRMPMRLLGGIPFARTCFSWGCFAAGFHAAAVAAASFKHTSSMVRFSLKPRLAMVPTISACSGHIAAMAFSSLRFWKCIWLFSTIVSPQTAV